VPLGELLTIIGPQSRSPARDRAPNPGFDPRSPGTRLPQAQPGLKRVTRKRGLHFNSSLDLPSFFQLLALTISPSCTTCPSQHSRQRVIAILYDVTSLAGNYLGVDAPSSRSCSFYSTRPCYNLCGCLILSLRFLTTNPERVHFHGRCFPGLQVCSTGTRLQSCCSMTS
jgi:hypothetical protein